MQIDEHDEEKRALERTAIKLLVDSINETSEIKLRLLYQQEKPDAVLQDTLNQKLGLEITHLFYNAREAKTLLGKTNAVKQEPVDFVILLGALNELIEKKEHKKKSYVQDYPISLLIRNASPTFGMSRFLQEIERIYLPEKVFQDIWFLSRDGTEEWRLVSLNRAKAHFLKTGRGAQAKTPFLD
jgi:hypothetical protein